MKLSGLVTVTEFWKLERELAIAMAETIAISSGPGTENGGIVTVREPPSTLVTRPT